MAEARRALTNAPRGQEMDLANLVGGQDTDAPPAAAPAAEPKVDNDTKS